MTSITEINTRDLKRELVSRLLLSEIPSYALVAELARREEGLPGAGRGGNIVHQRFLKFCAESFDLSVSQILSPAKPKPIADARTVSMAVAHRVLKASTGEIAKLFGRKDHSSVFHAKAVVESRNELRSCALDLEARWGIRLKAERRKGK